MSGFTEWFKLWLKSKGHDINDEFMSFTWDNENITISFTQFVKCIEDLNSGEEVKLLILYDDSHSVPLDVTFDFFRNYFSDAYLNGVLSEQFYELKKVG